MGNKTKQNKIWWKIHHFVHFYKIMVLEGKYIPSPYDSAWLWRYIRFKRSRCKVNVRAVWQAREVKETKVHSKDFWMCGFPLPLSHSHQVFMLRKGNSPDFTLRKANTDYRRVRDTVCARTQCTCVWVFTRSANSGRGHHNGALGPFKCQQQRASKSM